MSSYDSYNRNGYGNSGSGVRGGSTSDLESQQEANAALIGERLHVKDGRLFGFKVSQDVANKIQPIIDATLRPFLTGKAGAWIYATTQPLLSKHMAPTKAAFAANALATTAGLAITFGDDVMNLWDAGSEYKKGIVQIHQQLAPWLPKHHHGNSIAGLMGARKDNNEVVRVAMERNSGRAKYDVGHVVANLPARAWQIKMLYDQRHTSQVEREAMAKTMQAEKVAREEQKRIAAITDPKLRAEAELKIFKDQAREDAARRLQENQAKQAYADVLREDNPDLSKYQIDDMWEKDQQRRERLAQGAKGDKEGEGGLWNYGVTTGGSIISSVLQSKIAEKKAAKYEGGCALDMITTLRQTLAKDPEARDIEGEPIEQYIAKIFQQHQKDMHEAPIGERFEAKFTPITQEIARRIQDRDMDPIALVDLVGERKVVQKGGKAFAKFTEGEPCELTKILDAKEALFPGHQAVNIEEFYAEAPFNKKDVKATLKALKDHDEELSIFVSFFPDDVLIDSGMKKEDLEARRLKVRPIYCAVIADGIVDMATMSDEELKKHNLTEKEITAVHGLVERIEHDGVKAVEEEIGKHGPNKEGVESAVRAFYLEEKKGRANLGHWTQKIAKGKERIAKGPTPEEKAAKAKEKVADLVGEENAAALAKGEEGGRAERPVTGKELGNMEAVEANVPETDTATPPAPDMAHLKRVASRASEKEAVGPEVN